MHTHKALHQQRQQQHQVRDFVTPLLCTTPPANTFHFQIPNYLRIDTARKTYISYHIY